MRFVPNAGCRGWVTQIQVFCSSMTIPSFAIRSRGCCGRSGCIPGSFRLFPIFSRPTRRRGLLASYSTSECRGEAVLSFSALAVATDLHSDDTKAVLRVLIGDALDHPGEHLPIRRVRLRFHDVPCAAADASLHLCAVGAFEIDLPSSIEAMQLSSDSDEAPYAEESTDSEGIIRTCTASYPSSLPRCRTGYAAGIGLADQFSMGLPE